MKRFGVIWCFHLQGRIK